MKQEKKNSIAAETGTNTQCPPKMKKNTPWPNKFEQIIHGKTK